MKTPYLAPIFDLITLPLENSLFLHFLKVLLPYLASVSIPPMTMAKMRWTMKKRTNEDSDFKSPPPQSASPRLSPRLKKLKMEGEGTKSSPLCISTPVTKTTMRKHEGGGEKERDKRREGEKASGQRKKDKNVLFSVFDDFN
ncbi:hypothetical protein PanWU01x14_295920 [Parasponia andersonii]|uniref:Uncharacterized protein n=1 Tax=Parasponia andersonii TaxID=3476 RepID=A0A2P5AVH2_PARAD|nr:hypothetical protein PanWU01x14_295920 [Parasponia andersonii]